MAQGQCCPGMWSRMAPCAQLQTPAPIRTVLSSGRGQGGVLTVRSDLSPGWAQDPSKQACWRGFESEAGGGAPYRGHGTDAGPARGHALGLLPLPPAPAFFGAVNPCPAGQARWGPLASATQRLPSVNACGSCHVGLGRCRATYFLPLPLPRQLASLTSPSGSQSPRLPGEAHVPAVPSAQLGVPGSGAHQASVLKRSAAPVRGLGRAGPRARGLNAGSPVSPARPTQHLLEP